MSCKPPSASSFTTQVEALTGQTQHRLWEPRTNKMKLSPAQQVDQESRVTMHFEKHACLTSMSITGNKKKSLEKLLNNTSLVHPKLACQGGARKVSTYVFFVFKPKDHSLNYYPKDRESRPIHCNVNHTFRKSARSGLKHCPS